MIQRNLAGKSKPTLEITENGGRWTFKRLISLKNTEAAFELGQEFEFQRFDGSKVTSIFSLEGNKLEEKQYGAGVVPVTTIWEFHPVDVTVVSRAEGVTATEVYKRL